MNREKLLEKIRDNLDAVLKRDAELGDVLWKELIEFHPADIADFLSDLDREQAIPLFLTFPKELKTDVFAACGISFSGIREAKIDVFAASGILLSAAAGVKTVVPAARRILLAGIAGFNALFPFIYHR